MTNIANSARILNQCDHIIANSVKYALPKWIITALGQSIVWALIIFIIL